MLEKHLKFILGNCESQVVCGVDNEDYCFTLGVIVLPEGPVAPLSRHVEHREVDLVLLEGLDLETHGRCQLLLLVLLWLEEVYHGRFARVIKPNDDYLRLFIPHVPHFVLLLINSKYFRSK